MRLWMFLGVVLAAGPLSCGSGDSVRPLVGFTGGSGGDGGRSGAGGTVGSGGVVMPAACEQSGDMPFLWAKSFSKESAGVSGMALGSDDAIYLAGEYSSKLTLGPGQPGETVLESLLSSRDAFFAKLAPDGTLEWAKHAGGSADDMGRDVQVASDGSLRAIGVFEGTSLFGAGEPGETQLQAMGEPDMFVVSLAGDGSLQWVKRAGAVTIGGGTTGNMIGRIAGDGSLRILGSFTGTVSFGPGEVNETELVAEVSDTFLASYSDAGELMWVKRIGGSPLTSATSIPGRGADLRVTADGTTLVVASGGLIVAPGEPEEMSLGSGVNVARYDASGALLGTASIGGGGRLAQAALSGDGDLFVGGMFTDMITFASGQANETTLTGSAFPDSAETYLARLTPIGELKWAKQANLGQKGAVHGLGVAADGTFRLLAQYFLQSTLGPGELGAVQLTAGSSLIANYNGDGSVISAKDVSRWHSASNLPPAPPFVRGLSLSANDSSLRVVGYVGTSDAITLGEGEPGETVLDDVSGWIAAYKTCP